jgi:deoxyribonuclease IV
MSDKNFNIHMLKYNAGSHVPFNGTILSSIMFALKLGMNTLQFFMGNPQKYNRCEIKEEDIEKCQTILKRFPMSVYTHFPYSANLAGSVKDGLAWDGNSKVDWLMNEKIKGIEYELYITTTLGAKANGVIIHPGSYPNRDKGHKTVGETINKINFTEGSFLLLENCAGEGNKLCKTFTEIRKVLDIIEDTRKYNVGVCVDTAHIWGAGTYDLSTIKGVEKMFEDFDEIIGINYFKLLHLNDSKAKFGSKRDLHELICQGQIWGENDQSLKVLLNRCKKLNIPIILETDPSDVFVLAEKY